MRSFTVFHFINGQIREQTIVVRTVQEVREYIEHNHLLALKIQEN